MNNCLITKLKSVVDNSNLPKFGVIIFDFSEYSNDTNINFRDLCPNGVYKVRIKGDRAKLTQNGVTVNEVTSGPFILQILEGSSPLFLEIDNKYTIKGNYTTNGNTTWTNEPMDVNIKTEDYIYCTNIVSLPLSTKLSGKLEDLYLCKKIGCLRTASITGDLDAFLDNLAQGRNDTCILFLDEPTLTPSIKYPSLPRKTKITVQFNGDGTWNIPQLD